MNEGLDLTVYVSSRFLLLCEISKKVLLTRRFSSGGLSRLRVGALLDNAVQLVLGLPTRELANIATVRSFAWMSYNYHDGQYVSSWNECIFNTPHSRTRHGVPSYTYSN